MMWLWLLLMLLLILLAATLMQGNSLLQNSCDSFLLKGVGSVIDLHVMFIDTEI